MSRNTTPPADRQSPIGFNSDWGDYASTATLPNVASTGLYQGHNLDVGDTASVLGAPYVCTVAAVGGATWRQALHTHSTADLAITGSITISSSGVVPISAPHGFSNWQAVAATSGSDTTPATGTQFVTSLFVPCNKTITGVTYLIGSVGGTDKVYAVLYSSAGAVLANSDISSSGTAVTVGTAANVQALAFAPGTYALKGPGLFFVGISMNGNTARLRTVPAHTQGGILAGSVSQTHGTVAAITVPSTFTADKAPVVFLY